MISRLEDLLEMTRWKEGLVEITEGNIETFLFGEEKCVAVLVPTTH